MESVDAAPPHPQDGWVYEPDADWDSRPISSEQSGDFVLEKAYAEAQALLAEQNRFVL